MRPRNTETILSENQNITLTLTGSRAPHGIELGALDGFIGNFLAALRDFDRYERGEAMGKPGNPEASASAATALRIVEMRPGSVIAELEPVTTGDEEQQLNTRDAPRARVTIDRLLDRVEQGGELPGQITASLDSARRACGEDGAFALTTGAVRDRRARTVRFDAETIQQLTPRPTEVTPTSSIQGRLTRLEESPDKALIRSPDGTEWTVVYAPEMADAIGRLWRSNVYVVGEGTRSSPRRGRFVPTSITPLDYAQTEFFTGERVDLATLFARQGVTGPQGLDVIGETDFLSDEEEDAYFDAITDDSS